MELAIVLPFLTLLMFGIIEFGFMFRTAARVQMAARECARAAAAGDPPATMDARRAESTASLDAARLTATYQYRAALIGGGWGSWKTLGTSGTLNDAPRQSQVRVTLEYRYPLIMRGMFTSMADDVAAGTKTIGAQVVMLRS